MVFVYGGTLCLILKIHEANVSYHGSMLFFKVIFT